MAHQLNDPTASNISALTAIPGKNVMRFMIDAIGDIARGETLKLDRTKSLDGLDAGTTNTPVATAATAEDIPVARFVKRSIAVTPEKQRLALNALLESSFVYIEKLIDNQEISEAIAFSCELADRFHNELLYFGFKRLAEARGTRWLNEYIDKVQSTYDFFSSERNLREEKQLKQLLKLPASLRSMLSQCSTMDIASASEYWPKVQGDARRWLQAIQTRDIDLDRFVEALGTTDEELETLKGSERFMKLKLHAATRLMKLLEAFVVVTEPGETIHDFSVPDSKELRIQPAVTTNDFTKDDSVVAQIKKLGLPLNDYQCHSIESILVAIVGQDLPGLKRILTSFKGTPGDFNLVGRSLELILKKVGITVAGSYGPYWAFLSLETADFQHGIQLAMPSGKITGHIRGTTYSLVHTATALRIISRCVTEQ